MFSKNIKLENFKNPKIQKNLKNHFKSLIKKKNDKKNLINSFTKSYSYSFNKNQIRSYKKFNVYEIYGMGGSSLGAQAIYDYFRPNIKKNFIFMTTLMKKINLKKIRKKV